MRNVTVQIKYESVTENGVEDNSFEYTFDGKGDVNTDVPASVKKPLGEALNMFFKYMLDHDIGFDDFDPSNTVFKTDLCDDEGLRYDIRFYVS